MDIYNKQRAAQVWARVQGQEMPDAHSLLGLIQGELEDEAIYIQLSRILQGKAGVTLRQMAQQEQAHAACL